MNTDWSPLTSELARWRDEGRSLPLWWRDDDAVENTPALQTLLNIAQDLTLPVHVAVIPKPAKQTLADACAATPWAIPVVHGRTKESRVWSPAGASANGDCRGPDPFARAFWQRPIANVCATLEPD